MATKTTTDLTELFLHDTPEDKQKAAANDMLAQALAHFAAECEGTQKMTFIVRGDFDEAVPPIIPAKTYSCDQVKGPSGVQPPK